MKKMTKEEIEKAQDDFFKVLFGDTRSSWVGSGINARAVVSVDRMRELGLLEGESRYFTPNRMTPRKNRSQKNTLMLTNLYVDLDVGHGDKDSIWNSPSYIFNVIKEYHYYEDLPLPSVTVNTGRGLQMYWSFDGVPVNNSTVAVWKQMESKLGEILADYCFDHRVGTDISRLMRVPYTINKNTSTQSEILEMSGKRYTFAELQHLLLGKDSTKEKPTEKQMAMIEIIEKEMGVLPDEYKKNKKNARTTIKMRQDCLKKRENKNDGPVTEKQKLFMEKISGLLHIDYGDVRTKNKAREWLSLHKSKYFAEVAAYKRLQKVEKSHKRSKKAVENAIRNAKVIEQFVSDNRENNHCRETLLFLYRFFQLYALQDKDLAWEKTKELASSYKDSFDERKLYASTKSAEKYYEEDPDRFYGPNAINNMIKDGVHDVDILHYFDAILKRKDTRDRREYSKKSYANRLKSQNKKTKKEEIEERVSQIYSLLLQGCPKIEIVKSLSQKYSVSERTIRNYIRKAEDFFLYPEREKNSSTHLLNKSIAFSPELVNACHTGKRKPSVYELQQASIKLEELTEERIECGTVKDVEISETMYKLYDLSKALINQELTLHAKNCLGEDVLLQLSEVFVKLMSYPKSTVTSVCKKYSRSYDLESVIIKQFKINSIDEFLSYKRSEKQINAARLYKKFKDFIQIKLDGTSSMKKIVNYVLSVYSECKNLVQETINIRGQLFSRKNLRAAIYTNVSRKAVENWSKMLEDNEIVLDDIPKLLMNC